MSGAPPVAIICGAGEFPLAVASALQAAGREAFLIGLRGSADKAIEQFPHAWVGIAELSKLFDALQSRSVREIAIIGAIVRPDIGDLRPDFRSLKYLPDAIKLLRGGDNSVLSGITKFFEGRGLIVRGVQDLVPQLLAGEGALAGPAPDAEAREDIAFGAACLAALSPFDIGQGVVVARGRILAVEAAEGTDAMLARIAELRAKGRLKFKGAAGVLVKAPKGGQDLRVDLPAVGGGTLAGAKAAGLAGIAVAAGRVLIADQARTLAEAARAGLYLYGFKG